MYSLSSVQFDCAELINMIISLIIGVVLAYLTTLFYDYSKHRREIKEQLEKFQPLESKNDKFDWKHWNIENGLIAKQPIDSRMKLEYEKAGEFHYEWKESENGEIAGEGHMSFDDRFNGNLYFFTETVLSYKYRNVFYRKIKHLDKDYQAIFVDADDQKKNYVMMRPIN